MYLFYTNKPMQKHNENLFINTLGPMFNFKEMDVNHQSCPPFYKLSNDPNKTLSLHSTICIRKICWLNYMLVITQHLMVLWMDLMTFLKHYNILWKNHYMDYVSKFQNWNINKRKYSHYYDNNIESKWTPIEPIIKDIIVGKY
jgi:hypothetical protein